MDFKKILITAGFFLSIIFFVQNAFADVQNGLMISGISYPGEIVVNQPMKIMISVMEVKVKEGVIGQLDKAIPATKAKVQVTITKDDKKFELSPIHEKDGEYYSEVSFPEAGEWKVVAIVEQPGANHESHQDHIDKKQNVAEAFLKVKEENLYNNVILYFSLILLLFASTVWILLRIKKLRSR